MAIVIDENVNVVDGHCIPLAKRHWTINPDEHVFDQHIWETNWPDEIEIVEIDYEYHEVYLELDDLNVMNLVNSTLSHQGWTLEYSNENGEAVFASADPDRGGIA